MQFCSFEHYEKTKTKFKLLLHEFVKWGKLVRIKKLKDSGLKTVGDRFGDFLKCSKMSIFFNQSWKNSYKRKNYGITFYISI